LKLLRVLGQHLRDVGEVVGPYVLVSDVLKHFAGKLAELVTLRVNEMTEVPPSATGRTVEVATGHCPVVARFDELVWVGRSGCGLQVFGFVSLLELGDGLVGEREQLVVLHGTVLGQQLHNGGALVYRKLVLARGLHGRPRQCNRDRLT
jgi:hypothetical protein